MQLVLTYFTILTCLVVDSDAAMDPGMLELKGETRRLRGHWQHWIYRFYRFCEFWDF